MVRERAKEIQRLEKLLEDAGIKLSSVASDISGVSGRLMLQALIAGQRDPAVLAELAKRRLRSKIPALTQACRRRRAPGRHARLAVTEPGRRGTDEPKHQVIAKVDVDEFGQCSFGLGQIACAFGREVHVLGGA